MPNLTEAQSKELALWTFGTITAKSGHRNSVIAALNFTGGFSAVRQRLRRGDGQAKPRIILTALAPEAAGASWREMRF